MENNDNKMRYAFIKKDIEKPIKLSQLANIWGMDKRTLEKHFEILRIEFPEEDCLRREINGRSIVYPSDLDRIKQCQSIQKKKTN